MQFAGAMQSGNRTPHQHVIASYATPVFDAFPGKTARKVLLFSFLRELGLRAVPWSRNPRRLRGIHPREARDGTDRCRVGIDGKSGGEGDTFHKNSHRWEAQSSRQNRKVGQEKTMANNDSGASGLGWFLAGLGVGALIGVLYAPKAGKETREDLANAARDAKDKAEELIEQGKQRANEYVEQGKQYVEQGKQKAAELVEEGKRQAKESVDKGREYYEKGRTQWTQYVEKGKGLVNEQQAKVGAAVDAGKEAYVNTTVETTV